VANTTSSCVAFMKGYMMCVKPPHKPKIDVNIDSLLTSFPPPQQKIHAGVEKERMKQVQNESVKKLQRRLQRRPTQ
jgi:hypothetical protein